LTGHTQAELFGEGLLQVLLLAVEGAGVEMVDT
jgi:hypothetical protein